MKNDCYIKRLWFTGPGIEESSVEFTNGLNIIHGANDTGKSQILDSFDFMCGLDYDKFVIDKSTGCDTVHIKVVSGHSTVAMKQQLGSTKIDVDSTDPRIETHQYTAGKSKYWINSVWMKLLGIDKACGGGALMDLNVYNIHFVVGLFGMPKNVRYYQNLAENGVDTSGILMMEYSNFQAVCTAAKDSTSDPFVIIQGEEGTIVYPERPGYVRYGKRYNRITNTTEEIDVVVEEDPMKNEFLYMQEIIDTKNTKQMITWLEKSIATVAVLE